MQVGHIRENGYEGVYFEDDEGNTLGIERADSFDDDDVQNGLDTYCITLGTGQTVYGGIDRWEVDEPGHAWLLITPEASSFFTASRSATQPPVIEAQRVPPSAWITSQSITICRSPNACRSTPARSERPISR